MRVCLCFNRLFRMCNKIRFRHHVFNILLEKKKEKYVIKLGTVTLESIPIPQLVMASSATNLVLEVLILSSCLAFSRCEEVPNDIPNFPFHCGKLGNLSFPFAQIRLPKKCGFITVDGCNQKLQKNWFSSDESRKWYDLWEIYLNKTTIHVHGIELELHLKASNQEQPRKSTNRSHYPLTP